MDNYPDALTRLTAHLENLERRVSALEHSSEVSSPRLVHAARSAGAALSGEAFPFAQAPGIFPVLGKAMLGIAGAYVLRAIAESGSLPRLAVVAIALVYAGMWLVWAARVPVEAWFASATYAVAAALILAPMLWELTLRFNVLPTWATACVLGTFVIAASALAWKRNLASVMWVVNVTAVLTALGLLVATRDPAPFVSVLLLMGLASECAAARSHWLYLRPLVAAAADLAIGFLIYIYSRPESVRAEYTRLGPAVVLALGCILFLIYGASSVFRTMLLRQRITFFEIGQSVIAFLLAAFGVLCCGPRLGATVLGAFCLLLSAACYTAVFAYFDRTSEHRNYHFYATWSAALFLAGSFLCLPPLSLALFLSVTAIATFFLGVRLARLTLEFHGLVYLAAAAFASGLLNYACRALTGTFPAVPAPIVWIVSAFAVLGYAVGGRFRGEQWNHRLLRLLAATLAVSGVATFLVSVLMWLAAAGMTPGASHVAMIRTLTVCAVALALAFSGSRWRRRELIWIAYGTLAFVAVKLLFEDLQHGHPGSTAVSIFLYAVALIMVPRLARLGSERCPRA